MMRLLPLLIVSFVLLASAAAPNTAAAECVTVKYRDGQVCLDTFKCSETSRSSFVRAICYDASKAYMLINLNGTWYHYCSVDGASVSKLVNAESIGRYYNQYFRSRGSVHGPFDCRDHPVPQYQ
jgi:hypothetical protein